MFRRAIRVIHAAACTNTIRVIHAAACTPNSTAAISELGIHPVFVASLKKRGVTKLFPIQKLVFEPAMQGHDIIGLAKRGGGKTLAFGIPILEKIFHLGLRFSKMPIALTLAPKEAVESLWLELFSSSKMGVLCVLENTPIETLVEDVGFGTDMLVGTPTKILELLGMGTLKLNEVKYVVLDEADKLSRKEVNKILEKTPLKRQTFVFSAIKPSWCWQKHIFLNHPTIVDLVGDSNRNQLADAITVHSVVVPRKTENNLKAGILTRLITEHANGGNCIVFTGTKANVNYLTESLSKSLSLCEAFHGDKSETQREEIIGRFRQGKFDVLVATDLASRCNLPAVNLVIHYELPTRSLIDTFVDRSAHTGCGDDQGTVILIHTAKQSSYIKTIEKYVGCEFKELPGFGCVPGSSRSGGFGNSGSGQPGGFVEGSGDNGEGSTAKSESDPGGRSGGSSGSNSGQPGGFVEGFGGADHSDGF